MGIKSNFWGNTIENLYLKEQIHWDGKSTEEGKQIVVLVLGESTRGDHFSMNGYSRKTTPNLEEVEGIVSYRNVISNTYNALTSTPLILNRQSATDDSILFPEKLIFSAFKDAGFKTFYVAWENKLGRQKLAPKKFIVYKLTGSHANFQNRYQRLSIVSSHLIK